MRLLHGPTMVADGWSNLTPLQLHSLLRPHGQPIDGSKAVLVQWLTAFMSDDRGAGAHDDDAGTDAEASRCRRHCQQQQRC